MSISKELKKKCQRDSRKAYSSHANSLVSEYQTGNPKKLYSFIKSKKCVASGVAPLSSNGTTHSDSVKKSNILKDQFTSVFTTEDTISIPRLTPTAKPIVINRNGVLKLLKDINPYKATGSDAIPGGLLKTEVVDTLCIIFQASLDQGIIPQA